MQDKAVNITPKKKVGKNKNSGPKKLAELRKLAEEKLKDRTARLDRLSKQDIKLVFQELATYQIGLEMQNEELRRAQAELETSLSRYADLYDFAPVGYFTFNDRGMIKEVNLTGAGLLGLDRSSLINKSFSGFIPDREEQVLFRKHRKETVEKQTPQICEVRLRRKNSSELYARLDSIALEDSTGHVYCRSVVSDITERRRVEEALRRSEEQFHTLADSIPNLAWWAKADGYITWYNNRWYEYTGTTPEEMEGWGWQSVHDPMELPKVLEKWKDSIKNVRPFEMVFPLRGADGFFRPFLTRVVPVYNRDGKVVRWFGTNTDISEQRKNEEALRASEARYRSFQIMTGQLGWATNAGGEVIEDLPFWRAYTGQTFDEIKAWGWSKALHPDDLEDVKRKWRKAVEEKSAYEAEYRIRRYDGIYRHFMVRGIPLSNRDGSIREWVGTCIDITERKLAENLNTSLNTINALIHSSLDFTSIMSKVVSEAAKALSSETSAISLRASDSWIVSFVHGFPEDVIGMTINDEEELHALLAIKTKKSIAIHDAFNDKRVNRDHMKKWGIRSVMVVPLFSGDEALGVLFFNYHKNTFNFQGPHIDFADKLGASISLAIQNARLFEKVNSELAERMNTAEALKSANEELKVRTAELSAVNKELENFSYAVSHDLKAPLRSIEGFTKALFEDYEDKLDETGRDLFHRVLAASHRMGQLIDALLSIARLTHRDLMEKSVNLSSLAEIAAQELNKKQPERKVEFIIPKEIKARGDVEMLSTIIENLLDNAWKFTWKHPAAKIEFGVTETEAEKVYFVRDDGAGFDMTYADRLFKPFHRLHSEAEFPGIGIGLAIVQKIIEKHGGEIWAEGEVEKGATFYFKL